jgi:hypothetical protein
MQPSFGLRQSIRNTASFNANTLNFTPNNNNSNLYTNSSYTNSLSSSTSANTSINDSIKNSPLLSPKVAKTDSKNMDDDANRQNLMKKKSPGKESDYSITHASNNINNPNNNTSINYNNNPNFMKN